MEVTSTDILAFIDNQQSAPNRQGRKNGLSSKGPGLSNRTINRRLAAVASLYEYLRVFHELPGNNNPVPHNLTKRNALWSHRFGKTASLSLIRVPQTLPRPLDPEEIDPFVNSLLTHRDKAMVMLMLLAGLRKSEVLKLGMKDIDFGQHTLTVREGKGEHQRGVHYIRYCIRDLINCSVLIFRLALPLTPITPKAPDTGGVWLVFKSRGAVNSRHLGFPRQD